MNTSIPSTQPPRNSWLIAAGTGSGLVSLLHVAIVLIGPWAYRYFGAGELAPMAEQGSLVPAIATLGIAAVFAVFALYALAGAGLVRRKLPVLRPVLIGLGVIYTLRGLLVFIEIYFLLRGKPLLAHMTVFSLVSLVLGIAHLVGVRRMGDQT